LELFSSQTSVLITFTFNACLMEGKIKWLPCSKGTKNTWHLIQIQNQ
jgi:hypothetical protein